jgi:bla regulator protein BlaR1
VNARAVLLSVALALFATSTSASPPSKGVAADLSPSTHADGFILFSPGSQNVTMSGSIDDVRRAKSLRTDNEGLLYVLQGGSAYVIRDAATLRRAQSLFEPQKALGAEQSELGSRQAALGQQQSQLGAQQAEIGVRQAGSSPHEAEALARQQDDFGRQQDALGRQQNTLGRQQGELGREQDRLSRIAEEQLRTLFSEAIRSGLAQRVE